MPLPSVEGFLEELRTTGLLDAEQLNELTRAAQGRINDVRELAKSLAQRRWLTIYQIGQMLQGKGKELVVGPYQILDSLGAGGTALVFKAADTRGDHLVALKVVHPNLVTNAETVARFQREIQVVEKLSHPNIVRAYDAGTIGKTLYLAMELVEGTDLRKMVQLSGPLPIANACNYIRQTAVGLQHAHERGLVHRDIKPGNLFLTDSGNVIKIVDLGLARLQNAFGDKGLAMNVTAEGSLVGTADYLAPEQARNASIVDIRADIYSLGCTFYHLLVGQPPFPKLPLMNKLWMHANEEPRAVETIRPEVSESLGAIIRRMIAKKPEQRFQTPAEVAQALKPFSRTPGDSSHKKIV
jgi:serine/threonine-protein kinase